MDVRQLINQVIGLADAASAVIPAAGLVSKGAAIGTKIIDIIDELGDDIPLDQQGAAQEVRAKLAAAVKAKAAATSDRLRGD